MENEMETSRVWDVRGYIGIMENGLYWDNGK